MSVCAVVRIVSCFSVALGFPENHLNEAMNVEAEDNLTQMRMLHYMASENATGTWRAGTHTDIGCLTLLFQRDGEDGLEVCPGRQSHTDFAVGDTFYPVPAKTGPIVVNIGDMLSELPMMLSRLPRLPPPCLIHHQLAAVMCYVIAH